MALLGSVSLHICAWPGLQTTTKDGITVFTRVSKNDKAEGLSLSSQIGINGLGHPSQIHTARTTANLLTAKGRRNVRALA